MPCIHTVWRKRIGCRIFIAHFPKKSPMISGSFAETDWQFKVSYTSSPPLLVYAHVPTERESEKERKREEKGEFLIEGPCRCPPKSCQYCSPTSLYIVPIPNFALPIAAKKPRQLLQKSPMYCRQRALWMPLNPCTLPPHTITYYYIAAKEPYILPQKSPLYCRKRALYIAAKEPYILPQKSPIYCRKRALYNAHLHGFPTVKALTLKPLQ